MIKSEDLFVTKESDCNNFSDPCLMATRAEGIRATMPIGVDCPLNCKHCYQNGTPQYSMNLETNLLNFKRMAEGGVSKLYWDGAEPMTNKDLMNYLILISELKNSERYNPDIFATFSIATSGVLVNRDKATKLFDRGLTSIMISLDGGIQSTHDTFRSQGVFEKALKAIDILVDIGYDVRIGTALWKGMLNEIEEIAKIGADKGVKEVSYNWVQPLGNALKVNGIIVDNKYFRAVADIVSDVEEKYKGIIGINMHRRNPIDITKYCKGGKQIVYIAEDWIAPCSWINVTSPEFRSEMSLKDYSLQEILENDKNIQRFRKLVSVVSKNGAVCPAVNKMHNGKFDSIDPNAIGGVHNVSQVSLK